MSQRSVAMKGITRSTFRRMVPSRTSSPATMLVTRIRIASAARAASGRTSRRFALSSSVRSNHWVAAVYAVFSRNETR